MKITSTILSILLILACFFSCNETSKEFPKRQYSSNKLIFPDTTYNIELTYYGMGCPCPQWTTKENIKLYESQSHKIPMDSLFITIIEAVGYQQNPFDLVAWQENNENFDTFIFRGRMSENKLKWQGEDGIIWENKVFQYSDCRFSH